MQVTRPNMTWSPGGWLHPKACEAKCPTPKHLGTQVPTPNGWHALGTGYARKSGESLGFRPREGTCASTEAHPPGVTGLSRWRQSALRARFVGGHQSGLAGCKPPPVFMRRAFSCTVTGATPGGTMGRLSTSESIYLPTLMHQLYAMKTTRIFAQLQNRRIKGLVWVWSQSHRSQARLAEAAYYYFCSSKWAG